MKVFISQPMNGLTDEEILAVRDKAIEYLKSQGHEPVSTFGNKDSNWIASVDFSKFGAVDFNQDIYKHIRVAYLGKALITLAQCDAAYFVHGWQNACGCLVEHEVAMLYDIPRIHEE